MNSLQARVEFNLLLSIRTGDIHVTLYVPSKKFISLASVINSDKERFGIFRASMQGMRMNSFFFFFFLIFLFFLWLHLQPMDVPRLGVEMELQLKAYTTVSEPYLQS